MFISACWTTSEYQKRGWLRNSISSNQKTGVTKNELVEYLNSKADFLFSNFISLDDLLQINILLGRLQKEGARLLFTIKGEKYIDE